MDNNNIRFYYIRSMKDGDSRQHPFACVCMIRMDDGTMLRGVSICSPNEPFYKCVARELAKRNALMLQSLMESEGVTCIRGRSTSQRLRNELKYIRDSIGLDLFVYRDEAYAKASIVDTFANGGIPMCEKELAIWDMKYADDKETRVTGTTEKKS
jgi:hypothetical protein